ncbi:MAG: PEP/pyruvate-binding domain-containing protein [Candidatus Peregrinibacteria bacterium]|nr:PEP/pyruvate-binding domain-containing protein [Candidatus Peregrinibacteria bacterium]
MHNNPTIGAKTLKLSDLISLGLNVPKFKAIDVKELKENIEDFEPLAKKIHEELNCEKYAVRSSALIEDSQKESFAGQFKTKINVEEQNLASAIAEITDHARKFLGGSIEKFSVLIQEYIEPDIAGVTFTRNPVGGRELIIEYHKGRGEDLVSGNIKPEKLKLYWTDNPTESTLPSLNKAFLDFKSIELFYKFPQDVEWCIKDEKWYFLQTRPITTISETEYKQSLYLDASLPEEDFYYEKTEISEIAPRPTQITKDILEKVYEENGPIQLAYKKFNINYSSINVLKIIGNELFVDREEELKTLMPSYSYLKSSDLRPKLSGLTGIFKTIKNLFFIYRINIDDYNKIFQELKNAIENEQKINTVQEFLKVFEKDYQIVFEINLFAGISMKNIENLTKNDIALSLLLSQGGQLFQGDESFKLNIDSKNLLGNTIEISDESNFVRNIQGENKNDEMKEWWGKLSEIKKTMLKKKIQQVVVYNKLREMSRWLVVKRINQLREILFELAGKNNFKNKKEIYFAKLEEIVSGKISQNVCEERKLEYEKYTYFNMPKILTNKQITQKQETQGVSPGKAEGILIEEDQLKDEKYKNKDKILFTRVLSPELVKHFDEIKGIVSEQGGFLSHLSIIARERGLPVVTGVTKETLKIGTKIKIDGNTGDYKDLA